MELLKKYWWVIIILIVVMIFLYQKYGTKKVVEAPVVSPGAFQGPFRESTPEQPGQCSKYLNSKNELEAKINIVENQIDSSSEWMGQIIQNTKNSWDECGGLSYDECKRKTAIYVLAQQGWCIPKSYV